MRNEFGWKVGDKLWMLICTHFNYNSGLDPNDGSLQRELAQDAYREGLLKFVRESYASEQYSFFDLLNEFGIVNNHEEIKDEESAREWVNEEILGPFLGVNMIR